MVSFQPLASSSERVFCVLLTLDGDSGESKVLVDVGWDACLGHDLTTLAETAVTADLVLLTHATVAHLGAFCWLRHHNAKFREIPCYATLPVASMGRMLTIDTYRSRGLAGPVVNASMTTSDIEACFDEIQTIKYSQPMRARGGIEITAYNAGHTIGGTMWKIANGVDSVLYAADWNHARDAHLAGAFLDPATGQLFPQLAKPSLLVSTCPPTLQHLKRASTKQSRQTLLDHISKIIKGGGTVLIPTSSGTRVLELVLVVGQYLQQEKMRDVPLIYASYTGQQTLTLASAMLEWMVSSIITDWQVQNDSPFDIRKVHHITSSDELRTVAGGRGAKVVLATGEALESGLARDIFVSHIASDPASGLILTELCAPGTLGHRIANLWMPRQPAMRQLTQDIGVVTVDRELPLEDAERAVWDAEQQHNREAAAEAAARDRRNQEILEATPAGEAEESEESEEEEESAAQDAARTGILGSLVFTPGVYDADLTHVEKDKLKILPFIPKRRRTDDYGETLPSYLTAVVDEQDAASRRMDVDGHVHGGESPPPENKASNGHHTPFNQPEEPPVKIEQRQVPVQMLCFVACVDLNGLTNARSLEMIVKQVDPTRLLLLPSSDDNDGDSKETTALLTRLGEALGDVQLGTKQVEYSRTNFSVDVRLDPELESELHWHELWGGYQVARAKGTLAFENAGAAVLKPGTSTTPHEPVTIGDVRLTALKRVLAQRGVEADFQGQNILACKGSSVAVRRHGNGRFLLQGGVEPDYYVVRETLRTFLATM